MRINRKASVAVAWLLTAVALETASVRAQQLDTTADERDRRVVKILRTTNKAQVNQFIPLAFDFKNVNPYDVVRFIRRPIEAEEGNWWTFVHPDGNKGRVLVNVPIWMVDSMTEVMTLIDRPGLTTSSGDVRKIYRLKHRDPGDPNFLAGLVNFYSPSGVLEPDRPIGALYIEDAPSGYDYLMEMLEKLDKPDPQILVRVTIYELDLNDDGTIGLDFHAWKNGPGRNLASFGTSNQYTKINGRDGAPGVFDSGSAITAYGLPARSRSRGYQVAYSLDVPSAYLDYLVTKGKARVLTAPRATVRNATTASFETGEQIPYYRTQNGDAPIGGARPAAMAADPLGDSPNFPDNRTVTGQTQWRGLGTAFSGVSIDVQPTIAAQSINLTLNIEVTSHMGFDDEGVPQLSRRALDTDVRAAQGEEYIVGGLNRSRVIQSTRKIPILGSIPFLGWAFGGETTLSQQTTLAIVVSAEPIEAGEAPEPEQAVINAVKAEGMNAIETPDTLVGFDMPLLDPHSN